MEQLDGRVDLLTLFVEQVHGHAGLENKQGTSALVRRAARWARGPALLSAGQLREHAKRRRATIAAVMFAMRAFALLGASVVFSAPACGGHVVVEQSNGSISGATTSSASASSAASTSAGAGGADACSNPATCSRVETREGTCLGASGVGDFCDLFTTPCASVTPDCAHLGQILGAPATRASCGNGLFFCDVDWTGTLDTHRLGLLCQARATFDVPIDCAQN